jgi:hypothetical protein
MIPKGPLWRTPAAYAGHVRRRLALERQNVTTLISALLLGEPTTLAPASEVVPSGPSSLEGCCTCRQEHFRDPWYGHHMALLRQPPRFHRKQWEFHYIVDALRRNGMLAPGKRGVGFGVGREPLSAFFASSGIEIVATDMDAERAVRSGWAGSNEHAQSLAALNAKGICDPMIFERSVTLRIADMNRIPEDLRDFDFCWSACALEHLGSIERGMLFVEASLECLKPGGVAVHTTELNLDSNEHTLDHSTTVIPRRRDFEALAERLARNGHHMETLNFDAGKAPLDRYVDVPPYREDGHLKLLLERYASTSFGLTVHKAR